MQWRQIVGYTVFYLGWSGRWCGSYLLSSSSHKTFHAASARPPTRCSSILLIPYSCTFPSEPVEQNADENRKNLTLFWTYTFRVHTKLDLTRQLQTRFSVVMRKTDVRYFCRMFLLRHTRTLFQLTSISSPQMELWLPKISCLRSSLSDIWRAGITTSQLLLPIS